MPERIKDRRYCRTQRLLEEALIRLLKKKNIHEISIFEITEEADISRATFYLHYKSPYELLTALEQKLLDEIIDAYKVHDVADPGDFLLAIYAYVQGHHELLLLLLHPETGSSFWEKLSRALRRQHFCLWADSLAHLTEKERAYVGAFVIDGYVSVIKEWLSGGMQESSQDMVALSRRLQYKILPSEINK